MTALLAPAATTRTPPLGSPRSVLAVTLMFAANGVILGSYGGALPSLRDRLDLSAVQIAVMLFSAGAAGLVAMQLGGRLTDRIGARTIALAALPILVLAAVTLGLAPVYPVAVAGAVLVGFGNGAMDVAMNALGVQVESGRRARGGGAVMSRFHAFWSLGQFTGAAMVLLLAGVFTLRGAAVVAPVLLAAALVATVAWLVLLRIAPVAVTVDHTVDGRRTKIPRAAWVLGAMALAFGLCEGTAVDWSSIHVTDVARVDSTTGSLGLIAVSGFMVLIRLLGDRLVDRFGHRAVVRFGGACAAVGYLVVTLTHPLPLLVDGWALVGFGVGMIAPQVYATAGHLGGGRVLAVVVTFGYAAFLAGPGLIGFAVRHVGVQHTMALPAVLSIGIIVLAATMPSHHARGTEPELSRRQES
ncbi:MFS family permease [Friedmanniella endophytica]|uniref:MFS family permease n=1 Tax=Microlunatus kandeliicorticis TaxID=1759536 RepID=A0A7W3ISR8_9ACTN|nr:MFS transporter [Microlunatus kandeliicorticis]MBA8794587.1 MFS family permease [Microlunatus kandeliicorticis]